MNQIELENKGVGYLGKRPVNLESTPRTIIVVGPGRSGTSMIAGSLYHLGVFLGDNANPPVFEDEIFDDAISNNNTKKLQKQLGVYNSRYQLWAYKRPAIIFSHFQQIHEQFQNPMYIVTFRSVFSIANRFKIATGFDDQLLRKMLQVSEQYEQILQFLQDTEPYTMLVDYGKSMLYKDYLVEQLIEFCGINPTEEQLQKTIHFVQPNSLDYLENARQTMALGSLGNVTKKFIAGWARYQKHNRPAEVVLMIDDVEVARAEANIYRKDLKQKNIHPTGECGFRFTGFDSSLIKPGAQVRVKVVDDIRDLKNSPYIVP